MILGAALAAWALCGPALAQDAFDGRAGAPAPEPAPRFSPLPDSLSPRPKKSLAAIAEDMERLTELRHKPWFGLIVATRQDGAGALRSYASTADAAIWTGVYVAAQAKRYEVTKDPRALASLEQSVRGLVALHEITGVPGMIARVIAAKADAQKVQYNPAKNWHEGSGRFEGTIYRTDLSMDQYDGYLYGLAAAWPVLQDPELRAAVRAVALDLGEQMIKQDMRLVGPDSYLDFRPYYMYQKDWPKALRWVPLPPVRSGNGMHGLHLMKVAYYITGEQRFEDFYIDVMLGRERLDVAIKKYGPGYAERLAKKYKKPADALVAAHYGSGTKFTSDSIESPVSMNLSHIAYYDLARLETDPELKKLYRDALAEAHAVAAEEGNSFWNLLYTSEFKDPQAARLAVDGLKRLPETPVYGAKKNSADPAIPKYKSLHGNFFKVTPDKQTRWLAESPLPMEKRVLGTSFAWQHNPYVLDGGDENEGSGTAFLAVYWLARAQGLLSAGD